MPSATAAARSETPSFSYSRCGVGLHGAGAEEQFGGQFGDGQPARETSQHLLLAFTQDHAGRLRTQSDLVGQPDREFGRDHGAAAGDLQHGVDDLGPPGLLGEVALGAELQRPVDQGAVGQRRQQQRLRRQALADDRLHDREPVEVGHLVVQHGDVGLLLADHLQALATALGLSDHVEVPALSQTAGQAVAEERMIVDDHDPGPNGTRTAPN